MVDGFRWNYEEKPEVTCLCQRCNRPLYVRYGLYMAHAHDHPGDVEHFLEVRTTVIASRPELSEREAEYFVREYFHLSQRWRFSEFCDGSLPEPGKIWGDGIRCEPQYTAEYRNLPSSFS